MSAGDRISLCLHIEANLDDLVGGWTDEEKEKLRRDDPEAIDELVSATVIRKDDWDVCDVDSYTITRKNRSDLSP